MGEREDLLRRFVEEEAGEGRTVWASFDWTLQTGADAALEQQGRLAKLVDARKLVVKTAAIGGAIEGWSSAEAQAGTVRALGRDPGLKVRVVPQSHDADAGVLRKRSRCSRSRCC